MRGPRYRDNVLRILDEVTLRDSRYEVRSAALANIVAIKYGWEKVNEVKGLAGKFRREQDIEGLLELLASSKPYFRRVAAWSLYRLCKRVERSLCKYLLILLTISILVCVL